MHVVSKIAIALIMACALLALSLQGPVRFILHIETLIIIEGNWKRVETEEVRLMDGKEKKHSAVLFFFYLLCLNVKRTQ
jgi:hypothetical protein